MALTWESWERWAVRWVRDGKGVQSEYWHSMKTNVPSSWEGIGGMYSSRWTNSGRQGVERELPGRRRVHPAMVR